MGTERKTTQQQVTPQATGLEQQLNVLGLERQRAAQPGMMQAQAGGLNLINQLLTGQALPGYLEGLPGGISPEAIGTQAAQLAGQYGPGFQQMGIADSGVAFRETARGIGQELLFPAEQFNIQNLANLLQMAIGGQYQVQQPVLAGEQALGQRLAGLRPVSQAGAQIGQYDFFTSPFTTAFAGGVGQAGGTSMFGVG